MYHDGTSQGICFFTFLIFLYCLWWAKEGGDAIQRFLFPDRKLSGPRYPKGPSPKHMVPKRSTHIRL